MPTGTWRFLLVRESPEDPPTVIGTFVETQKGRLLFFPGADIEVTAGRADGRFENVALDHLTLDPPRPPYRRSHIAVGGVPEKESRGLDYRAPATSGYMFPWFSFLVPDTRGFSKLPLHLWVELPKPRNDLEEYGRHLIAEGGVILFPLPAALAEPHYIQFDVWVGTGNEWAAQRTEPLAWAYKPELHSDVPTGGQDVRAITTDTPLPSGGIRITTTRPQGRLQVPRILRPRFNPPSAA
jgi:hypothetical protein